MKPPYTTEILTRAAPITPADEALIDQVYATLTRYAGKVGLTLDADTLAALMHGIAMGQLAQALHGDYQPGDDEFDSESMAFYGIVMYTLAKRFEGMDT